MKIQIKRILCMFLIISIVLSVLPLDTFSADIPNTTGEPYTDVSKSDWFYDAVIYAKENGIFNGMGTDTFSPDGKMTRAMYVTMLAHIAGIDASQYKSTGFSDVAAEAWYAPYAEWAAEKGITLGTGNGKFSPDAVITREQMATLTFRYFTYYAVPFKTDESVTTQPKDLASVSPWAREAVLGLWQAGLFKGDSNGNFNPVSIATRAEAAVFGMRTDETVKIWNGEIQENPTPVPIQEPSNTRTYTIIFNTNGGEAISNWTLQEGSVLNNLPIPYKEDSIFTGWYMNSNLSEPVEDGKILTSNITLYAEYSIAEAVDEIEMVPYVSKMDQEPTFTIGLDSTDDMTAEQVEDAITFSCLTNPDFTGFTVTGGAKTFTIAAQGGAFNEGDAFKVLLNDERLSFTGEDPSSTIYNFSIAKPEVLNLGLAGGMLYIPASDISDMTQNGENVMMLSVPVAQASNVGTQLSGVELSEGSFTYSESNLQVGDNLAIYEGISPLQRDLDTGEDEAGAVAYVTITQVDGDTYSYESSDSKDVLFTPDILPVSNTADTDNDPGNNSITVSEATMTFTNVNYAEMGLGADTTVDVGDYIAFYSGDFNNSPTMLSYECITQVTKADNNYTITYVSVSQEEMMAAMELSNEKNVDGDQLLEDVDVASIEEQIEQQAIASGFIDESTAYLASLALETDSFNELNSDFNLKYYDVEVFTPKFLAGGEETPDVELENLEIDVALSTDLEHYNNLSGVRCELNVSFDVVIHGEKNDIVIKVTGTFEEEVRIIIKASGGAVWKYKGIFPYIADYRINATIDAYNYTGIKVDATIGTFKKSSNKSEWADKTKFKNIAAELKTLMNKKDEAEATAEDPATVADSLADQYSEMLNNKSDWVELINQELFNNEYFADPYHILVYGVKVNFVVSANMNVSIGCEFKYENAKRYIFSLGLYSGTSSSDTLSLVEGKYKFTAYVMGTLGLKAGIRIEIATGLFSLKLSSIGLVGDVGAYLKLWGYFYYELNYSESGGKTSKSSGALYIEMGIYLKISFKAQAFKGTFKYNPTLYDNEWPLWFVGSQKNVNDFSYTEEDTPKVSMAKNVKTFVLPDSVFKMQFMDMKTGEIDTETFDDSKDFKIKMSNSDFTYDETLNTITVNPGSKVISDGKMTITWKSAPLAFSSESISRTIPLHWENLKDTYSISFNSKGGSTVKSIVLPYNSTIITPANPQKAGYVFEGWYLDQNLTQAYTLPTKMPAADVLVYAKWSPAQDTKYTVEHYQQNILNDLYTLADTDRLVGETDSSVSPVRKSYAGFTAPVLKSLTIAADGSGIIKYYYTRNKYTLTFNANGGNGGNTSQVKVGSTISAPIVTKSGYVFSGWSPEVAATMPNQNTTYTAQWAENDPVQYKVEHYQQNIVDDSYTLFETENLSGVTNANVTGTGKTYTGLTYNSSVQGSVVSGNIAEDGSLVLKLYYTRNKYTLTFNTNGGAGDSSNQVKVGATITPPTVTKTGYVFAGWSPEVAATMPNQNTTYTAQWTERLVPLGDGTEADPYLIESYTLLKWVSDNNTANAGFGGKYFKQMADIDMTLTNSVPWIAIGNNTNKFNGTYDGNGYSVENLYIHSETIRQGLFGVIGITGTVMDLGVTSVDITCTANSIVTPGYAGAHTGALVGTLYGSVLRCYATGTVTGDGNTGGLIGYAHNGTIKDSYSTCTVIGNGASVEEAWDQLGGLLGKLANSDGRIGSVSNSYATGNVTAPNHDQVAGLVGEIDDNQEVYSSFATGTASGNLNIAGIVGILQGPMRDAYTTSSTSAASISGAGTVTDGNTNVDLSWFKTESNFTTVGNWHESYQWDFENTWAINPSINNGLPYLQKSKLGR